ncbi:MAG: malectin domain-containing carbohydrate-binding protein [Myxococcaceae bacterium]
MDGPTGFSRNNIWHVYRANADSLYGTSTSRNNDVDFELHNGDIQIGGTGNRIGPGNIRGTPVYASGSGAVSRGNGMYQLAAGSPGFDGAQVLPNFNDGFAGTGPDIGAHEAGTAAMKFGRAAATAVPPPPPTSLSLPFALNAGGGAAASFVADTGFAGGQTATNWTGAIDTAGVTGAAPAAVYQAERYGDMGYAIAGLTPGASLKLRLHFCENYHSAAGQRAFNVAVNGARVLDDFDVFAAGAAHKANVQQFDVTADASGQVVIGFTSVTDQALVNGIEVLAGP